MDISILDYGAGNLKSITNVLDFLSTKYQIISTSSEIEQSDIIILPGVGHFGQLIDHFNNNELSSSLINHIKQGKPYLGICLGMQILFEESEEAPGKPGLNIFPGRVRKFNQGKVPQIGWNILKVTENNSFLENDYFYFVNSYYVDSYNEDIVASKTNYYIDFVSGVQHNNVLAMQFHPEKSGAAGCKIIKRWLEYVS